MTKLDGSPISMTATYNIVVNEFIKGGGDGFTAFASPSIKVLAGFQGIDTDAFINYIKSLTATGEKIPSTMPQEKFYETPADASKYTSTSPAMPTAIPVYRLYNRASKAHLWTTSLNEYKTLVQLSKDWKQEGIVWQAPNTATSAVYCVYSPKSGKHLYTGSSNEAKTLRTKDWKYEGLAFYSSAASTGSAVYRLYNSAAGVGSHFVTSSANEKNSLISRGWKYEGIAWYKLK